MDAKYFKEQICEELHGAKAYAKHAIEIKAMNADWSKSYITMSEAELDHATKLYRMFGEYYMKLEQNYDKMPDYIVEIRECINEMYAEKYQCVHALHEAYNNL